jgi:predicted rRNA methylase YqxC with S4 and FtsJ domains
MCAMAVDLAAQPGWRWHGYIKSPISGCDGDTEFMLGVIKSV